MATDQGRTNSTLLPLKRATRSARFKMDLFQRDGDRPAASMDLFQAAAEGCSARIDALLSADPSLDVNASRRDDSSSWTPLHVAAAAGHTSACRALIGWGASPDVINAAGETPLQLCASRGHVAVFAFLLAHGGPSACACCIPKPPTVKSEGHVCEGCEKARKIVEVASAQIQGSASFRMLAARAATPLASDASDALPVRGRANLLRIGASPLHLLVPLCFYRAARRCLRVPSAVTRALLPLSWLHVLATTPRCAWP